MLKWKLVSFNPKICSLVTFFFEIDLAAIGAGVVSPSVARRSRAKNFALDYSTNSYRGGPHSRHGPRHPYHGGPHTRHGSHQPYHSGGPYARHGVYRPQNYYQDEPYYEEYYGMLGYS